MRELRAVAYALPLLLGLAMGALRIDDFAFWGPSPRTVAPLLWRAIDLLLYPFAMVGLPLLAPSSWIWLQIFPSLSRLIGAEAAQNAAAYVIVPCLLFTLYLAVRGRSMMTDALWRISGTGSIILVLFGLLSILSVKGSGDGQAAIAMVMCQNGGVVAAVLAAELLLRRARGRSLD